MNVVNEAFDEERLGGDRQDTKSTELNVVSIKTLGLKWTKMSLGVFCLSC